MKIAILGAGYVGLNTAAFAWLGHDVRVIDEDRRRTAQSMRQPVLVDARNFTGADVARWAVLRYDGIGRDLNAFSTETDRTPRCSEKVNG